MQIKPVEGHTVERTVRFYRVTLGRNQDGSFRNVDFVQTLSEIEKLPFLANGPGNTRYLQYDNGRIAFTVLSDRCNPVKFKYYQGSRTGLPQVEDRGRIESLQIADSAGLVEAVHGIFFPPDILALETSGRDFIAGHIAKYIRSKGPLEAHSLTIEPLIHKDIVSRLHRLRELSLFKFTVRPSFVETVRAVDQSLAAGMSSLAHIWEEQDGFEILIKPTKNSRPRALGKLLPALLKLATMDNLRSNSTFCQVNGLMNGSARTLVINLLTDKLTTKKEILLEDSRVSALDASSAFRAIAEAYDDLRVEIAEASGAIMWPESADGGNDTSSEQKLSQLSLFHQSLQS